jgi:hypothetical protein
VRRPGLLASLDLAAGRLVIHGAPLVEKQIGQAGAQSRQRALMRAGRRALFERFQVRDDLMMERLFVAYQLVRGPAGEVVARRAEGEALRGSRAHLSRSPSPLVRTTGVALTAPGLLRALRFLDSLHHRR